MIEAGGVDRILNILDNIVDVEGGIYLNLNKEKDKDLCVKAIKKELDKMEEEDMLDMLDYTSGHLQYHSLKIILKWHYMNFYRKYRLLING